MSHVLLLVLFLGFAGLYATETVGLSMRAENLILVVPAAVLCVVLSSWMLIGALRTMKAKRAAALKTELTTPAEARAGAGGPMDRRAIWQLVLLAVFPFALPLAGFDAATSLFVFASLWVHGERRLMRAIPFAIAFGFATAFAMDVALPLDVPLLWERVAQ